MRGVILAAALASACASLHFPLQERSITLTPDKLVRLTVTCDGVEIYSLFVDPSLPVEIGGPELGCVFSTVPQDVKLKVHVNWEQQ